MKNYTNTYIRCVCVQNMKKGGISSEKNFFMSEWEELFLLFAFKTHRWTWKLLTITRLNLSNHKVPGPLFHW